MAITIDDIYDKEFTQKGGGYDRHEVDQFLDEICDEMTNRQEDYAKLQDELVKLQQELKTAKESVQPAAPVVANESVALQGIMDRMQRFVTEEENRARTEADAIIKKAQDEAGKLLDDAQNEKGALAEELEKLRAGVAEYKDSFLKLITKYKDMLEGEELLK